MALRTCLRRAAHQLSSRSLLASAATQSRGLTAAVAGGDDNGGEYVQHIWKSSEGQYAAQLASGRWVHVPIKMARNSIETGAEVIEDTKPAGFDERINIPEDTEDYESLPEAAQAFIDAATSNSVRAKWCMDGAGSIEEAAQMLEAYAAYVRGLSKDGWYAGGDSDCDYFCLCRDLIAKEEGEKPAGFERIQDSSDATQVFVEEDPPDQLSTGEEGPAHCASLRLINVQPLQCGIERRGRPSCAAVGQGAGSSRALHTTELSMCTHVQLQAHHRSCSFVNASLKSAHTAALTICNERAAAVPSCVVNNGFDSHNNE